MISVVTLYISRIAIVFSRRYFKLKRLIYSFAYSGLLKGIFASTLPLITIQYIFFTIALLFCILFLVCFFNFRVTHIKIFAVYIAPFIFLFFLTSCLYYSPPSSCCQVFFLENCKIKNRAKALLFCFSAFWL